jgi:Zn finger protein HypA/HybF involved in hydrogenase expression
MRADVELVGLVLACAAVYLLVARVWPYVPCRWCSGSKRYRAPRGKAWRNCPHCGGRGRRVRLGARLLGYRD